MALDLAAERARDLGASLDLERARAGALVAELGALRAERRLPWWARLLPFVRPDAPAELPEAPPGGGPR